MEAFVITLREGVEAALIVGLILTFLRQTGRDTFRRWVYAGLVLALVGSLVGAIGFSLVGIDPENELFEGALMGVAALLVVSLVVWMWRASREMKQRIEGKLENLTASGSQGRAWGLMAFVFFMVFREGVETILFLGALSLTERPDLVGLIGGLVGLGLAAVFGVLFFKGSLRINLRRFFAVTSFVLLILAVRLAAGSVHEFYEVGLLAGLPWLEEITEFLSAERTEMVILAAMVALPLLTLLPELRSRKRIEAPAAH